MTLRSSVVVVGPLRIAMPISSVMDDAVPTPLPMNVLFVNVFPDVGEPSTRAPWLELPAMRFPVKMLFETVSIVSPSLSATVVPALRISFPVKAQLAAEFVR